jgi:hypothetical protein
MALSRWVALAAVVLIGATTACSDDDAGRTRIALKDVPQGVSAHKLDGRSVFLARDGSDVVAFLADPRHLPGETLYWCPRERQFASPMHGETFDAAGRPVGGLAFRDLNRLEVAVQGDSVVSLGRILFGGIRRQHGKSGWDLPGGRSYCQDPIKSLR